MKSDQLNRREFAGRVRGAAVAGAALAQKATAQTSSPAKPIDLAEWSYFWLGVERATLARGTVVNGNQMYVEYWIPARVAHPYSIVMVHGGGGQGTDWMGSRSWARYFLEEGFRVYVVDRPGHGRSPFHPDLMGPFPAQATTYEVVARQFTAPEKAEKPYGPQAAKHTQWPGTGVVGDPAVDQVVPGQGGSFLNDIEATHEVWKLRLGELLDKIGPAMIMSHSMGGPSAWIAAEARPNLVKGMIGVEPAGPPFGALKYGVTACKMTYDPPVNDASELKTVKVTPAEANRDVYFMQAEPARKLKNLQNIPAVIVTSEASYHVPYDGGTLAFLKQAGVDIEQIYLPGKGITGNAHFMMMEKNNREVLQPILDWIAAKAEKGTAITSPKSTETALKLADFGYLWVGTEHKKMPYGTIATGQMYVQYLIPQQVTQPLPVVLVHGGGGSMLHYMGLNGMAGCAHYYAQAGYRVYLVDRPGHGRAPYHPDALGAITPHPTYESVLADIKRSQQWAGSGDVGDPLIDQFQAGQNAAPRDNAMAHRMWARAGAELLDKIGPAIIQVHSAGGPFGYLVANERPKLVRAIVNVEGGGSAFENGNIWGVTDVPLAYNPPVDDPKQLATKDISLRYGVPDGRDPHVTSFKLQTDGNVHKLKNLIGIPIVYIAAERSGRDGTGHIEFLKQAGCSAEYLPLVSRNVLGNGHFMMLEKNRKQVFDVIDGWLRANAKA